MALGKNRVIILVLIIATFLVGVWFRDRNIMGMAESGLPFYNFQLAYDANKSTWNNYALGFPTNISIAAMPTYWLMAQMQNLGIPGFLLQASFFWLVLVISGISIYYLTKTLFPILDSKILILSVLFYWFNPFSMINVWNRFLNNFLVFYMFLPVVLLFLVKGLKDRKYFYAILIGLISAIFSYALTSIAFNFLIWLVIFYITVFFIFINNKFKDRLFVIGFFLLTFSFFCLVNLWWISQIFSYVNTGSYSTVTQTSFSSNTNQTIFATLSHRLGNITDIIRLQHATFLSEESNIKWIELYTSPLISGFSFLLPLVIFLPLVIAKKNIFILLMSGLMIVSIFLSKGSNSPFGEILNFAFQKAAFLQAFRNAFEKFGFILPLAGAPLFAFGIFILKEKFKRYGKYIYSGSILWVIMIFGLPFWTGLIFTNNEFPASLPQTGYQVKVPQYYKDASIWLSKQADSFHLLVFPIGGEGITYNWEKGYAGVELSNQLLPKTSVSFQTNVPFYENISKDLEKSFINGADFTKVANALNAKYIVSRNDIDWRARTMRDPQNIFNELKIKKDQFKLVKNFGALTFWENLKWQDKQIYSASEIVVVSPQATVLDYELLGGEIVILDDDAQLKDMRSNKYLLHPTNRFSLGSNLRRFSLSGQDIFPHVKYSPGSKMYNPILLKERFELKTTPNIADKVRLGIQLLGKRLVEAKTDVQTNNDNNVLIALREYEKILTEISSLFPEYANYYKGDFNKQFVKQEDYYSIFFEHKKILKELINSFSSKIQTVEGIKNIQKTIDSVLINAYIQPAFGFLEDQNFPVKNRIVYKFDVKDPGDYELFWGGEVLDKYYKNNSEEKIALQIDNKIVSLRPVITNSGPRSFGKIYFSKGVHEISLNADEGINLIDTPPEIKMEVKHGEERRTFPIKNYDPYASYTLSFDYYIKLGSGLKIELEANNSKIFEGKIEPDYSKFLGPDNYDFGEKHLATLFKVNKNADSVKLILKTEPWNDCESIFFTKDKKQCDNLTFRYPYDRTTEVLIKNISVTRNLVDEPVLIKLGASVAAGSPDISISKINNTKYLVKVENAKDSYILILSELFDPGWKLFTEGGKEFMGRHLLANAYANGWEVDKKGNYQLIIEFTPQRLLNLTSMISLLAFIFGFLILILKLQRKNSKND